jgi:hypothetical protein
MELTELDKTLILEQLAAGPVVVAFTKKDGTERIMPCTTSPTIIMFKDKGKVPTSLNYTNPLYTNAVPVFDLEANEWRSFRWSAVKTVVPVESKV